MALLQQCLLLWLPFVAVATSIDESHMRLARRHISADGTVREREIESANGADCLSSGLSLRGELRPCVIDSLPLLSWPSWSSTHVDGLRAPLAIIHYSKADERKQTLEQILAANGMSTGVYWLDRYDRDQLSTDMIQCLFTSVYGSSSQTSHGPANAWAQYVLFRWIVEEGIERTLVIEDDPVFTTDSASFKSNLNIILDTAPTDFDAVFFGGCLNIHAATLDQNGFGKLADGQGYGRCNNGYAISLSGAKKMLAVFKQGISSDQDAISCNLDWMFNNVGSNPRAGCAQLNVFLTEPPLFDNGSIVNSGVQQTHDLFGYPEFTPTFHKVVY